MAAVGTGTGGKRMRASALRLHCQLADGRIARPCGMAAMPAAPAARPLALRPLACCRSVGRTFASSAAAKQPAPVLKVYIDMKSPHAYLVLAPVLQLEADYHVEVDWVVRLARTCCTASTCPGCNAGCPEARMVAMHGCKSLQLYRTPACQAYQLDFVEMGISTKHEADGGEIPLLSSTHTRVCSLDRFLVTSTDLQHRCVIAVRIPPNEHSNRRARMFYSVAREYAKLQMALLRPNNCSQPFNSTNSSSVPPSSFGTDRSQFLCVHHCLHYRTSRFAGRTSC